LKSITKIKAPNVEILIVDDNMINVKVIEEILKSYEMNITTARSGFECLSQLQSQKKRFDIVFMDYMMPDMDGRETLTRIRQFSDTYYKSLPIIALTASETIGMRESFLETGFDDYMTKPVDIIALNKCLCKFISPRRIMEINDDRGEENTLGLQIEGIDAELGVKYANNNIESYLTILRDVCKEANKQKKMLIDYKVQKDWRGYATLAHGIKGEAASIGACEFAKIAKEHEVAAKSENEEFINYNFSNFIESYNTILANIQKVIEQDKEKEDITYMNTVLTKQEIEKTIKLVEMYEHEDSIKMLNWLRGFILTQNQKDTINATIQLLEELEFEEAKELLLSLY
jgi:CheY-like chemotaxis protein